MTIQWRNIEMPLGGIDQFTNAAHVLPGKLREAENIRFYEPPKMTKRYGSRGLVANTLDPSGNLGSLEPGKRLTALGKTLVACTDYKLYTYSNTQEAWAERGYLSPCHISRHPVWAEMQDYRDWDSASNGGITVFASPYGSLTSENVVIADTATKAILSTQKLDLNTLSCARVLAVGDYIYIFSVDGDGSPIMYSRINIQSGDYQFPAPLALDADGANLSPSFDVCNWNDTHFVVAFSNDSTNGIQIKRVDADTLSVDDDISLVHLVTPDESIAVQSFAGGDTVVVYDEGFEILAAVFDSSFSLGTGGTVASGLTGNQTKFGIAALSATNFLVTWEEPQTAPSGTTPPMGFIGYQIIRSDSFALVGGAGELASLKCASKPFAIGEHAYQWVSFEFGNPYGLVGETPEPTESIQWAEDSGDQETAFLVRYTDDAATIRFGETMPLWSATAARGIFETPKNYGFLPQVHVTSSGVWSCAISIKQKFSFAGVDDIDVITERWAVQELVANFDPINIHQSRRWGDGMVFAGGRPSWFDGALCSELGFAWRPAAIKWHFLPDSPGAVTSQDTGTGQVYEFGVQACYEMVDALGYIHRSAPSDLLTLKDSASSGMHSFKLQLDETLLSDRLEEGGWVNRYLPRARLVPYRTITDGSELHRAEGPPAYGLQPPENSAEMDFADDGTPGFSAEDDESIQVYEYLYTTGDILDNAGLPACKLIEEFQSRLWLAGLENPEEIWFSQPYVRGEGPRFNETLSLRMAFPVTAMANLETQLIVFGEHNIQAVVGGGPPATGGLDIGFRIMDIPSDVGCIDPRSVVVYQGGVLFQSRKGLYRLGRDLTVTHIGLPVVGLLQLYSEITSAVVMPERSEVVWTCERPGANRRLVWNYELDQWSLDTLPDSYEIVSACVVFDEAVTGTFVYGMLDADGTTRLEDSTVNTDGNNAVETKFVTPWIKLDTLQDWVRVRGVSILLKKSDVFDLKIEIAYDQNENWYDETLTVSSAELDEAIESNVLGSEGLVSLYVDFERQVCRSVRLRISEVLGRFEGEVQGPEFISLVFEGGFEGTGRFRTIDAGRR